MKIFSNRQVEKIVIDESLIKSIAWVNEFKDIAIDISWCGQDDFKGVVDFEKIKTSLYFDFVTEFETSIKFKERTMGALEITSFTFELEKDSWAIEFKFAFFPVGSLKFNCNDFRFVIDPA